MLKCEVCGKEYKSRSGLGRHMKSKHPSIRPSQSEGLLRTGPEGTSPSEVGTKSQASGVKPSAAAVKESQAYADALVDACEELGIHADNVMSYKVYEDRVVIIEGPVGYKRIWARRERA